MRCQLVSGVSRATMIAPGDPAYFFNMGTFDTHPPHTKVS